MRISDWSSDVCSSDLKDAAAICHGGGDEGDRKFIHHAWHMCRIRFHARKGRGCDDEIAHSFSAGFSCIGYFNISAHIAEQFDQASARGIERSEEHTSELQSLMRISYDVFCLKKKKKHNSTQDK